MNILFFLTPKSEVAFIYDDETLRQALEKMEYHKYSAVPVISRQGKYIGTITEGDMLWGIKNQYNLNLKDAEHISVTTINRRSDNRPVYINATMEDLIDKALNQNFVPVVDDQKNFIGIITRKDIIRYCYGQIQKGIQNGNPKKVYEELQRKVEERISGEWEEGMEGQTKIPPETEQRIGQRVDQRTGQRTGQRTNQRTEWYEAAGTGLGGEA